MVMMISRFHRLIQSRLLWGAFLVIIVFSFVIWGTRMPSQSRKYREANAAGKLSGKWVTQEEFRKAYFSSYMAAALAVGRPFDITKAIDEELRDAAWRRLAALQEAEKMGLRAADEEVMGAIQSQPAFAQDGRFSPQRYAAFIQNVLAGMGFTELQFEQHIREEIALQKVQSMLQQAILVSPFEINRTFRSLSDSFEVEYVAIKARDVEKDVKVTREDAYSFFAANPTAFKIPEKVKVQYVAIPVAGYVSAALVTNEEDALAYYDEHIEEYARTNRVKVAAPATNWLAASTNAAAGTNAVAAKEEYTNKVVTLTFDEVKTNILEAMTFQAARDRAADVATDFVVSLAPDREGKAVPFDEAAQASKLEVRTAGPIAEDEKVKGVDAGIAFTRAAFNLNKAPDEYFSDAVLGDSNVYVIALEERIPARTPEFDEVAEEALEEARAKAAEDALAKKAQDFKEAAVKALEKGDTFKKAAAAAGLKVQDTGLFTIAAGFETNEYADVIVHGIIANNQGEITDPLPAEDAIIVAYLANRKAGDPASLESLRPQIEASVKRQRTRLLYENWQEYLLKQAQFEDRMKTREEAAEAEEAEAAEEGFDTNDVPPEEPASTTPGDIRPEDAM